MLWVIATAAIIHFTFISIMNLADIFYPKRHAERKHNEKEISVDSVLGYHRQTVIF